MSGFSLLGLGLSLAGQAVALPPYQRLYQAKYGYKPSCTACHDRDSWENTAYGKAFWKSGRNLGSFAKIEGADHDEDGIPSGAESDARANPGDPRSTPKRLGDWLKGAAEVAPPRKHLSALFPEADRFQYGEAEVTASLRGRIEKLPGVELRDEDLYPSYFEAFAGERKLGAALYGSSSSEEPCFYLAAYTIPERGRPARVTGLRMLHCRDKALGRPAYLRQYEGKGFEELGGVKAPKANLEPESAALVSAVRRGLTLMQALLR